MSVKTQEKLVLIDGNALVHRAYHALPPLSHQGEPTNAVYGFTSVLIKVLRELKPDYVVATFDLAAPTFRHEEFAEYKAHREKTPDDLVPQFAKVKEVVRAFGIPIYEQEGFEADDLIGTIADKIKKEKHVSCIIITGDLDTLQLVNENTHVLTLKKGITDTVVYDDKAVKERFGIAPAQMADFKGLKGDPSDNIPGVSGVGDKTATDLLARWGTIEDIYEHFDELTPSAQKKLKDHKDEALFSKSLATIRLDVPITFDLQSTRFGAYDRNALEVLFKQFGFFTLISRLDKPVTTVQPQTALFAEQKEKKSAHVEHGLRKDAGGFAKASLVALLWDGEQLIVSNESGNAKRFSLSDARDILENPDITKIGYDTKRIMRACFTAGIAPAGFGFDALIAAYLLSPGERDYSLERICLEVEVSVESPDALFVLKEKLEARLRKEGLVKVFTEIELPLIPVLARMEHLGIRINGEALKTVSRELEKEKDKAQKIIWELAGEEFNIDSPIQLSRIVFEKLGVKTKGRAKKTKTGMVSTRAGELEKLREAHPIIAEILSYRELAKLKSTYADALLETIQQDGRVHTAYSQTGTATGRLASSEPNLQNLPQKGEWARVIRNAFIADDGFSFASFDFSQIELRIVASLSGDEKMMRVFREGGDIHRATAAEVHGISESEVTPEMRSAAKALNFGILYGMGQRAFAESAGIDTETARRFIDAYFKDFSGVAAFIESSKNQAVKYGFVQTLLGRKRWLPDIRSKNPMLRSSAERMAQNMPIQGLQADIIKLAMIRIQKELLNRGGSGIRLLLQIHDELVFELKDDIMEETILVIRSLMEGSFELKVPLVVGVKTGKQLGALRSRE